METADRFKGSPLHDKKSILDMMDKLNPESMTSVVSYIIEKQSIKDDSLNKKRA